MGLVLRLDPSYVVGAHSARAKAAIVLKSQGRQAYGNGVFWTSIRYGLLILVRKRKMRRKALARRFVC